MALTDEQRARIDYLLYIAVGRSLGWEDDSWEEPPGHIMASLKVPCGFCSLFLSRMTLSSDSAELASVMQFFKAIRRTKMYRWYGNRKPTESKLTLSGAKELLEVASKLFPKLKEAGLLDCDGCCPVDPDSK